MIDGETGGDDAFFSFGVFNWYELSTSFFVEFGCFIVIVVVVVVVVSVRLRTCPVVAGFCFLSLGESRDGGFLHRFLLLRLF